MMKYSLRPPSISYVSYQVLERGKYAQTPLAAVSPGSDEMSLGSDENSDARPCAMRIWRAQI